MAIFITQEVSVIWKQDKDQKNCLVEPSIAPSTTTQTMPQTQTMQTVQPMLHLEKSKWRPLPSDNHCMNKFK